MNLLERHIKPLLLENLSYSRIVGVLRPRQPGKTTLAREVTRELGGEFVTLGDDTVRATAQDGPVAFVHQHPDHLLTSDEVQRAPQLALHGSFPELRQRPSERTLSAWFESYVTQLTQRDALETG
ncbi:hypothetical protein [Nesterenkonia muleiensis]|uniref:hypothetical protein n=1 Tax=Nesterenkonia muleiensis TaxID=2282648 RepID=UPI000E716632|nr:hypothetical protein [Nesterenkonia muleiensis]